MGYHDAQNPGGDARGLILFAQGGWVAAPLSRALFFVGKVKAVGLFVGVVRL